MPTSCWRNFDYSPICNCWISSLIRFWDPEVDKFAKTQCAYWVSGSRDSELQEWSWPQLQYNESTKTACWLFGPNWCHIGSETSNWLMESTTFWMHLSWVDILLTYDNLNASVGCRHSVDVGLFISQASATYSDKNDLKCWWDHLEHRCSARGGLSAKVIVVRALHVTSCLCVELAMPCRVIDRSNHLLQ